MPKITDVRVIPYNYTMTRKTGDVHLPEGTDSGSDMAVFIDTDEGVTGVSVGYGQGGDTVAQFAGLIIGEDPRSVRALWDRTIALTFKTGNAGGVKIAVSALDAALWDLKAKLNGVPLWKELGALRGEAAAYPSGLDTPLDDDELADYYTQMADTTAHEGMTNRDDVTNRGRCFGHPYVIRLINETKRHCLPPRPYIWEHASEPDNRLWSRSCRLAIGPYRE